MTDDDRPAPNPSRPGRRSIAAVLVLASVMATTSAAPPPARGITAAAEVAAAYDTALDADFEALPGVLARTCGPAPAVACLGVRALGTWWEIVLDPDNTTRDARFSSEIETAIAGATAWTTREPERAEAWFYLGAALAARGQWRILRNERVAAARDGKRIKETLERALALDPSLHDADFGIGAYRYYAGVAPAYLRWLRWLLLLPGGDRADGLARMERASVSGHLVRAEADYQLLLVYLWYEHRVDDALTRLRSLQARYPHNPQFPHLEAVILDAYAHQPAQSLAASERLLALADRGAVHRADLARVRARLNIAAQLHAIGERDRARAALDALLAASPAAPIDAVTRARTLQRAWRGR